MESHASIRRALTIWSDQREVIHTSTGAMTMAEWAQREAARLRSIGRDAEVREDALGRVAIIGIPEMLHTMEQCPYGCRPHRKLA